MRMRAVMLWAALILLHVTPDFSFCGQVLLFSIVC